MGTVWKSPDGNVCIIERPSSPYYQMQVKAPGTGKWLQKSSKKTEIKEASIEGIKWHAQMTGRVERGGSPTSTPFKVLCENYHQEIDEEISQHIATDGELGRNLSDLKSYKKSVDRYILPYIGVTDIEAIGSVKIQELIEIRRTYWATGEGKDIEEIEYERNGKTIKRPATHGFASLSTLKKFTVILKRHFEIAVELNLLDEKAVPVVSVKKSTKAHSNRKKGKQPRPAFTVPQYKALLEYMPDWCWRSSQNPQTKRWAFHRLLLRDIIRFLGATAIRPGTESDHLRVGHIRHYTDKRGVDMSDPYIKFIKPDGELRVKISISRGKTGAREAVGDISAVEALWSIQERYWDYEAGITDRDDYVEGHLCGRDECGLEPLLNSPEIDMPDDRYLFTLPDGTPFKESSWRKTFKSLIKDFAKDVEIGSECDALGRKFIPYSLRHFWISTQLQSGGLTIHQIAKQAGNSVKVIETSYDKSEVESFAHKAASLKDME